MNAELSRGGLVPIASGKSHDAAISIRQHDAVLRGGRLAAGETVVVPDHHAHVFVTRGSVNVEGAAPAPSRSVTPHASRVRVHRHSSVAPTGPRC